MMLPKHSAECRELLQKIPLTKIFSLFFFPCCTCMCIIYDKLYAALRNNAWVKGIKRASPLAQTTCLEGFHSVLNHFMPKMIAYSYIGMYCSWTCFSLDLYLILMPLSYSCYSINNNQQGRVVRKADNTNPGLKVN